MTETTIALRGVTKRYGPITAVRDLDLGLHAGEVVALVGHNGAGKTTQIKMMLGLARPTAGTVRLFGADPAGDGFGLRAAVGYLPESVSFHLALTGRETLGFYARLKRLPPDHLDAAFDLDGDGIADGAYRPNDIIDRVMWTAPQARLLMTSPAVQVIRWAQSRFPATLPGGVVDSAPLMAPPESP